MAYDITIGSVFSGRTGYALFLYARRNETDNANNRSTYAWECYGQHQSGTNQSYSLNPVTFGVVCGNEFYPSHNLDFRGVSKITLGAGGAGPYAHDANGYLTVSVRTWSNTGTIFGNADTGYQAFYTDRIPKPPSAPGTPSISNIDTTSVTASWAASNNNNGAGIDSYLLRWHTNPNPDAAGYQNTSANNLSRQITGLTPGVTYYTKVYAHNSMGFSVGSGVRSFTTKSGAYVGAGGSFPAGEVLVGVGGSYQTAQVYFCADADGPYVEAK
ncbi:minor tail protein [Microbacterium phage Gilda]|uniref:Minor tail protein n=3 Tax=Krampusvirus krampus TaxID=2734242 RepID=A0A4Y6EJB0_9CAUD|nr:minor tail protein [Microbacterium phage Anakin]QDF18167.1 minor tail protein [Microbacterium phage NarutoRun]QOC58692.1 minor tail protein [Microbacterium phage Gilda]WIC90100.1 minor tail protein [Microbacterium phage Tedro]